jgi:hypothetical protein
MQKLILLALLAAVTGARPAYACDGDNRIMFDTPVKLEGVLKSGQGKHDVQGAFDYVYLELAVPLCVDAPKPPADEEFAPESLAEPVTRVQIAGEAAGTDLPIGSRVQVDGTLFAAHTMWHVEDVLIDAAEAIRH